MVVFAETTFKETRQGILDFAKVWIGHHSRSALDRHRDGIIGNN
jgi:hypothetical protein